MDCGTLIMLYVGLNVPANVLEALLGKLPDPALARWNGIASLTFLSAFRRY